MPGLVPGIHVFGLRGMVVRRAASLRSPRFRFWAWSVRKTGIHPSGQARGHAFPDHAL